MEKDDAETNKLMRQTAEIFGKFENFSEQNKKSTFKSVARKSSKEKLIQDIEELLTQFFRVADKFQQLKIQHSHTILELPIVQ